MDVFYDLLRDLPFYTRVISGENPLDYEVCYDPKHFQSTLTFSPNVNNLVLLDSQYSHKVIFKLWENGVVRAFANQRVVYFGNLRSYAVYEDGDNIILRLMFDDHTVDDELRHSFGVLKYLRAPSITVSDLRILEEFTKISESGEEKIDAPAGD